MGGGGRKCELFSSISFPTHDIAVEGAIRGLGSGSCCTKSAAKFCPKPPAPSPRLEGYPLRHRQCSLMLMIHWDCHGPLQSPE